MTFAMRVLFATWLLLCVAGCKDIVHSGLKERDANEIVAVLNAQGIMASKQALKGDLYSVSVNSNEFSAAVTIMSKAGLPRETFRTMGEVFPDDNVVGTPFEERARFSYALSQELAASFTQIDGVVNARVHVVIGEKPRFEDKSPPSKAAVAIYHKNDFDAATHIPKIKTLLAFSVPDLTYDDVSIALFRAGGLSDVVVHPTTAFAAANATLLQQSETGALVGDSLVSLLVIATLLLSVVALILRVIIGIGRGVGRLFRHAA